MLGRTQKTSRLDVGLALMLTGVAYLVWLLVAGFSRELVRAMLVATEGTRNPMVTKVVRIIFLDAGFLIYLVGLAWLVGSLALVLLGSRQKISISWAWMSAVCQASFAAGGAVLVGWGVNAPYFIASTRGGDTSALQTISAISLVVTATIAVVVWIAAVVWLLIERSRLGGRRGPTLRDSLRDSFSPFRR